jgi:hypothetical protein
MGQHQEQGFVWPCTALSVTDNQIQEADMTSRSCEGKSRDAGLFMLEEQTVLVMYIH